MLPDASRRAAAFCLALGVSALLFITGCATAQQNCILQQSAKMRTLAAQIKTSEATIARGYAVHRQTVPYTHTMICYTEKMRPYPCPSTRLHRLETPVSVDLEAERARLAELKAQYEAARPRALAGVKACQERYPE